MELRPAGYDLGTRLTLTGKELGGKVTGNVARELLPSLRTELNELTKCASRFKVKVGADLQDDMRRCRLIRDLIGPDRTLVNTVAHHREKATWHVFVQAQSTPHFRYLKNLRGLKNLVRYSMALWSCSR